MGASTTRLGMRTRPMENGAEKSGAEPGALEASARLFEPDAIGGRPSVPPILKMVPAEDDLQALERQQRVELVERGCMIEDDESQAAGSHRDRGSSKFYPHARHHPIHLAGEAVERPRLHGVDRVLADNRARVGELDLEEPCGPGGERIQ